MLVHGSGNTSRTWEPVVARLERPVLAVDLPGRRYRPADLTLGSLEASAGAVVSDVRAAGLGPIVLVGHSAGGLILPEVAAELGSQVRHLVFVAGLIAAHGHRVIDTVDPAGTSGFDAQRLALLAQWAGHTYAGLLPGEPPIPTHLALIDDSRLTGSIESLNLMFQTVSWSGVSPSVPRSFVRCLRDPIQPPAMQAGLIANCGADEVFDIDTTHTPAQSEPAQLAELLERVAARYDGHRAGPGRPPPEPAR